MRNIIFFFPLILLYSCFSKPPKGELTFTEASPGQGFNYPYFLFIPEDTPTDKELTMIVEPNNSGFANDDITAHIEKAKRIASLDFYIGNYVATRMNCPLLVPVFPRPESEWKIYTHALDRDVVLQKGTPLERIDIQLIKMIEDAGKILCQNGYRVDDQVFIAGFSASGTFANRFTAIHPRKVKAIAAGGINGLLILPVDSLDGEILNYPIGTNDFKKLFGEDFDKEAFLATPQFLFMGELDDNDAIPYEDGYEPQERELVYRLIGEEMHPTRWENCMRLYRNEGANTNMKTFVGIGHEQPETVKKEILNFFVSNNK
jgi:hypothetical protein